MNMIALIKLYMLLFKEFFFIGVFAFGGGYATLPFLYELIEKYGWYSVNELSNAIALSAITPGPIGINIATFAGNKTGGILAALIATFAEVLPAFFIVILVYKFLKKFEELNVVKGILYAIKPTSCALLTYVCIKMIYNNLILPSDFRFEALIIFTILILLTLFRKLGALSCMVVAVLIGYVLKLLIV